MKRKPTAPVFKPYVMNQVALLPPSYDELIPENHLVRVVYDAEPGLWFVTHFAQC